MAQRPAHSRADASGLPATTARRGVDLADGVGFEPTSPCGLAVFKTAALSHSATHPAARPVYLILRRAVWCGPPLQFTP